MDTSTDVVTLALHDGESVVGHRVGRGPRRHAEVLAPLIGDLLAEAGVIGADLAAVHVGVGPGAYTGLRVGLVTAATLGLTWGVPVHGACSLDALAVQAVHEHPARCADGLLVVTDARRRQVFWARYTAGAERVSGPAVDVPEDVPSAGTASVGSGALARRDLFTAALEPAAPDASWLARGVQDGLITEQPAAPLYLRLPDVSAPAPRKDVLQPGRPR